MMYAHCKLLLRNAVYTHNIANSQHTSHARMMYAMVDIAVLQIMGCHEQQLQCVLSQQRLLFAELPLCSTFPTGKTIFLFVAGTTVAAGVTVLVHLKTKPCMRGYTTVCYQETGSSRPSTMVTGRD